MILNKTNNWINVIDKLIKNYNNTEHSTMEEKPGKVNEIIQHQINVDKTTEKIKEINENFKLYDHVRILKDKKLFSKGTQKYTKSIYKIIDKDRLKFKLQNIDDHNKIKFALPNQLLKININTVIRPKITRKKDKQKQEKLEYKQDQKQKRFMNKEGLN